MVSLNPFKKKHQEVDPQTQGIILASVLQSEGMRAQPEEQFKADQGTNWELLHDEDLEALLNYKMYRWAMIDGKPERIGIDNNWAALRVFVSHLFATSVIISPRELNMIKLNIDSIIQRIKLQMRRDEYTLDEANLLDSIRSLVWMRLGNACNGNLTKYLKTTLKGLSVSTQFNPKPERSNE
jgi:hypothetical protein